MGETTIAVRLPSAKEVALSRQQYLEGFSWAAIECGRLLAWKAEDDARATYWAERGFPCEFTYTPEDALREHAVNAALLAWEGGDFARGLAAGYYSAMGQEVEG